MAQDGTSQTQELAGRIYALAARMGREPSTISRTLLGSGVRLAQIASGKSTMTLDVYHRVERELSKLERQAA